MAGLGPWLTSGEPEKAAEGEPGYILEQPEKILWTLFFVAYRDKWPSAKRVKFLMYLSDP
jgi:hypothetical protein